MIVSIFSGNMLSGKTFEIFFPALFMMLLAPRNIEPKPIANEKKITTKPINSDENQACCGAKSNFLTCKCKHCEIRREQDAC